MKALRSVFDSVQPGWHQSELSRLCGIHMKPQNRRSHLAKLTVGGAALQLKPLTKNFPVTPPTRLYVINCYNSVTKRGCNQLKCTKQKLLLPPPDLCGDRSTNRFHRYKLLHYIPYSRTSLFRGHGYHGLDRESSRFRRGEGDPKIITFVRDAFAKGNVAVLRRCEGAREENGECWLNRRGLRRLLRRNRLCCGCRPVICDRFRILPDDAPRPTPAISSIRPRQRTTGPH
ncbi:hypothetical protein HZ326_25999 [Fusarium oxysporum f. sp. albedinis]|nr:hypothetical protein HZ326_25999 [Fusarium oxysporum f. sp. albedinis]